MRVMERLEYEYVVEKELKITVGKHFDKMYFSEGIFRLKISNININFEVGKRINIAKYITKTSQPHFFVQYARKFFNNRKLEEIKLREKDRTVIFDFGGRKLILEMFGKGNGIIVNEEGIIEMALKEEEWRDRKIKRGIEYIFAPVKEISWGENEVIKPLIQEVGKSYAKYLLRRMGIEETTLGKEIDEKEFWAEVEKLKKEAKPYAFLNEKGEVIDFGLYPMEEKGKFEERESLSEVIDEYYYNQRNEKSQKIKALEKSIEKLKMRIEEFKKKEDEARKKGEWIYTHYQEVEKVLEMAKEGKFEELERMGVKVKVNKKEKYIEWEIEGEN